MEIIYHRNDKYNRDLAEIFVNGESLAKTMLKNGYGWVYRGGIEPSNYAELLQIENSLRGSNIGLWANNTCSGERKPVNKTMETTIITPVMVTPTYANTITNTNTNTNTNSSSSTYSNSSTNHTYFR